MLLWEIIAAKLQDKFTNFVPKRRVSLQVNDRYKEISLSSVILLQKNHPSLGFRPSHPAYATIGCNRLRKFHKILDKGANILLRILYSIAHPHSKWIENFVKTNARAHASAHARMRAQVCAEAGMLARTGRRGPPARPHARTDARARAGYARPHARMLARTQARTHACARRRARKQERLHARTHARRRVNRQSARGAPAAGVTGTGRSHPTERALGLVGSTRIRHSEIRRPAAQWPLGRT